MGRRRRLAVVLAVVAALALVAATGSFSSAALDRGVEIAVAGDDDAYLGVATSPGECDGESARVTLTNRVSSESTLAVSASANAPAGIEAEVVSTPTLHPGESGDVVVELSRTGEEAPESTTVSVTVVAAGDGVEVRLTRSVGVECPVSTSA